VALDLRELTQEPALLDAGVGVTEPLELALVRRGDAAEVLCAQKFIFDGRERAGDLRVVLDRRFVERDGARRVARAPAAEPLRFDERARAMLAAPRPLGELNGDAHRLVPISARLVD